MGEYDISQWRLVGHRYTPQVTQRWPRGSKPASINDGETTESLMDGHDQRKIYTIRDHTLEVLLHWSVLELHAVRVVNTPH